MSNSKILTVSQYTIENKIAVLFILKAIYLILSLYSEIIHKKSILRQRES